MHNTCGFFGPLGAGMAGKIKTIKGKALVGPLLLVGAKTLLLPILNAVLISAFEVSDEVVDGTAYSLQLFGFLLGTFPTAPSVFLYASEFGVLINEATTGVILCTAISGPLTLVTAQLAELTISGTADYLSLLQNTSESMAIVSMVGAMWLLIIYLYLGQVGPLNRLNVVLLACLVLVYCITVQTCRVNVPAANSIVRYIVIQAAMIAIRLTVMMNGISLAVLRRRGKDACARYVGSPDPSRISAPGPAGSPHSLLCVATLARSRLWLTALVCMLPLAQHSAPAPDYLSGGDGPFDSSGLCPVAGAYHAASRRYMLDCVGRQHLGRYSGAVGFLR